MKTEIVTVTPKLAREWLKRNTNNRALRPSHVESLRISFARGEYVMTHQGICFDSEGVLIDGQHRLAAIASQEDCWSCKMLVTHGADRQTVFMAVDAVQAKRSAADVLQTSREVGEIANFFARLYSGSFNAITPQYVAPFADFVATPVAELLAFCPTSRRTWSSAPVRAAAVIASITHGDADFVKLVYRALVLADFASMPPSAQVLFRAHMGGKVRAAAAYDIFCRGLKVFDPRNQRLSKIQINDQSKVIASVRAILDTEVFGRRGDAPRPAKTYAKQRGASAPRLEGL